MALNINEIRSQLALGGARPTLFQVIMNNPVNAAGDVKIPFMVKGSQIPASSIGTIEVPYFGRKIKIAGDRTFAEWSVTVINDEDFLIRNSMEEWMQNINSHLGNLRKFGLLLHCSTKKTLKLFSLAKLVFRLDNTLSTGSTQLKSHQLRLHGMQMIRLKNSQ